MAPPRSAKATLENVQRIEPTDLNPVPGSVADAIAELAAAASSLGDALRPRTAASLAEIVRIMNAYYSNLIEGHNTLPRDIARAIKGDFDRDEGRRNLQIEARAHVRVQAEIDRMAAEGTLPEPASRTFILWLHREFYKDAPEAMLHVRAKRRDYLMRPGAWRSRAADDVVVGRHQPPASARVAEFMRYFEDRYRFQDAGMGARIVAIAAAHHRFNYIHPFPDGNGRVSRLMSHAMAHKAGIGSHGLWSVSRGLARGLREPTEYKTMLDDADAPRDSDRDGRGNLSQRALAAFVDWFLRVCIDQARFMSSLFELNTLADRLLVFAREDERFKPGSEALLVEAAIRGEVDRGDASRVTGLSERSARRVLTGLVSEGWLDSETPKGPVSLRFPAVDADRIFPRLFPGG